MDNLKTKLLIDAVQNKANSNYITALIEAGADVNALDSYGFCPLISAAAKGFTEIVSVLLAAPGIQVNQPSSSNRTAPMHAAFNGYIDVVNLRNKSGAIALMWAFEKKQTKMITALLNVKAIELNQKLKEDIFKWVIADNQPVTLKALIPHLDPKILNAEIFSCGTRSALLFASENGQTATVASLLTAPGIHLTSQSWYGFTALMLAAKNNHSSTVQTLIPYFSDTEKLNAITQDNESALMMAAIQGYSAVVSVLLAVPGIQVNQTNLSGNTALMLAAANGDTDSVDLLLNHSDILVNLTNYNGETALMCASKYKRSGTTAALLKVKGIELLQPLKEDIYKWAVECNHPVTLNALIPHLDAKMLNTTTKDNETALMMAAKGGHTAVVATLLSIKGIDKSKINAFGYTAFSLAKNFNHIWTTFCFLSDMKIEERIQSGPNLEYDEAVLKNQKHLLTTFWIFRKNHALSDRNGPIRKVTSFLHEDWYRSRAYSDESLMLNKIKQILDKRKEKPASTQQAANKKARVG